MNRPIITFDPAGFLTFIAVAALLARVFGYWAGVAYIVLSIIAFNVPTIRAIRKGK